MTDFKPTDEERVWAVRAQRSLCAPERARADGLQERIDKAAATVAESYEYGGISQSERDRFMAALNGVVPVDE